MSTATNLLSLLNQLQLMENSLTNFMLETILKIQSLTETKVFLLLENSGGAENVRRFCGTRDLVESFENGRLLFKPTDVEVTLDPSIASTVVERPRFAVASSESATGPRSHDRRKKRAGSDCEGGVMEDTDATNGAPPVKRPHMTNDDGENSDFGGGGGGGGDGMDGVDDGVEIVKREVVEFVIGDSDDEEDRSNRSVTRKDSSSFLPQPPWTEASNPVRDNFDASQYRPSNELSARKLEALQSIENPTAVFEKGTLENKLLSSILYDYGKELACKCPYEDVTLASAEVKSYFYGNLEQFLSHFQRFTMEKTIISDLLKTQSPQSYMRNIARSGYKAATKTVMKKRGENLVVEGN